MAPIPVVRALAIGLILAALAGLMVAGGAGWPAPVDGHPAATDVGGAPEAYIGEEVRVTATVVDADANRVAIDHAAGTTEFALIGADGLEAGTEVRVAGVLADARTIDASGGSVDVREPWERLYLYLISLVGGLIAVVLAANYWRPVPARLAVVPRTEPLHRRLVGGRRG